MLDLLPKLEEWKRNGKNDKELLFVVTVMTGPILGRRYQ